MPLKSFLLFCLFVFGILIPEVANAGLRDKFHGLCLEKRYVPNADAAFCNCLIGETYDEFLHHLQYGAYYKKAEQQKEMLATIIKEPGMSEQRVDTLCNLYEKQFAPASPAVGEAVRELHKKIQDLKAEYPGGSIGQDMIRSMMVHGYCRAAYDAKELSQEAAAFDASVYDSYEGVMLMRTYQLFVRYKPSACK